MKLLLIGTDRTVFSESSATRRRLALFGAKYTEALDTIVFSARTHGIDASQELAPTVHAYPTNSVSRLLYGWDALRCAQHLQGPDIISAQDPFETGLAALFIARYFRVPLMVEMHTDFLAPSFVQHSLLNRLRVYIARFVLRRAAGGYAVSERLAHAVREKYQLKVPIGVQPIYVDTKRYASVVHTQHPRFATALLWVGRLEKEKNPMLALNAFIVARKEGFEVGLTFVGDGSLLESLKAATRREGVEEWVEFVGHARDMLPYYAFADLLLVTSVYEGYGMVTVEALSTGVPVLSTNVGIATEAGSIVVTGNDAAYVAGLISWLRGPRARGVLRLSTYASQEEYFTEIAELYASRLSPSAETDMRLLILTQIIDVNDTSLSFFHAWIEEFSKRFDSVQIICLKEGEHHLPSNVRVYSLGKEGGRSRWKYISRFYRYIWQLRKEYDSVFVHMNQEYVVLGGWFWRLMGKRVAMWRNYHSGNFLTDVAAFFCNKVFCTSTFSYTAKYKKTILMPLGIDADSFVQSDPSPAPNSILSFGRIAPSKRIEVFIEALSILKSEGVEFTADIYGNPLPKDEGYLLKLRKLVEKIGLEDLVKFFPGVPHQEVPRIFTAHELFVNASPSGMYDKMLFEAVASGSLTVASSGDWSRIADDQLSFDGSAPELAKKLRALLALAPEEKARLREHGLALARSQSLQALGEQLSTELH